MTKQTLICQRLKRFGYASDRRIRLYGEELQLVSNPLPDGDGFSVVAITLRTGNLKHVRIPLSIVSTLERELEREEAAQLAA
jgi:hypothetical protein